MAIASSGSNGPNVDFGQQVELSGFADLDTGSLLNLKKIVDKHLSKMNKRVAGFAKLKLVLKKVHHVTGGVHHDRFELKAKAEANNKLFNAEHTDHDLFVGVNKILRKIEEELGVRN